MRWIAVLGTVALGAYVAVRLSVANAPVEPPPVVTPSAEAPVNVLYTDVPSSATLGESEGWLEVHAPGGAHVLVDGIERPAGPVAAGAHDVRVGERSQSVEVHAGKTTRVDWP